MAKKSEVKLSRKVKVVTKKDGWYEPGDCLQAWQTWRAKEAGGLPSSRPKVRLV